MKSEINLVETFKEVIDYLSPLQTPTEQVKEYLKSVENLKTRLNAIGAKSVLRK